MSGTAVSGATAVGSRMYEGCSERSSVLVTWMSVRLRLPCAARCSAPATASARPASGPPASLLGLLSGTAAAARRRSVDHDGNHDAGDRPEGPLPAEPVLHRGV